MSDVVRHGLDRAAQRGTRWLTRRHRASSAKRALQVALGWSWIAPLTLLAIYLGLYLVARPFGASHAGYGWPLVLLLLLGFTAFEFGRGYLKARAHRFERERGLALLDERLGLHDRLRTADQFLREDVGGDDLSAAFTAAAIDDANQHLERIQAERLDDEPTAWIATRAPRFGVLAAGLLSLVALWLPGFGASPAEPDPPGVEVARAGAPALTELTDEPPVPEPLSNEAAAVRDPEASRPSRDASRGAEEAKPSDLPDDAKDVEGRSARGESGEASSAAGSSEARGVPSDQGQSSKSAPRKPTKKKKAKKLGEAKDQEPTERKEGEESGSTAGLGSASGSNKNPASTSWSSKDQVTDTEDEDIEDDEDVDDEDSESEARGGLQPSLRDRKPAASRDLSIGFGNRPNPNARGRGGPSQPKKSRGTASLILGVPIPDHIKGQPNPGKTKITQERIQPKADPLVPANAQPRDARRLPAGRVPETPLSPWMRDLVRDFFHDVRARSSEAPAR